MKLSSRAHLLLTVFIAASLAAAKVSSASVVSAIEDTEVLGHLLSNGESKASEKNFDNDSASSVVGQGIISASRSSLAQTESFIDDETAPAADGPFLYTSSCPVPLDECVLPTTDYFESPLASWKLRSGHSFAPRTSTGGDVATDVATNCCLCDIAKICFSDKGEYIGAQAIGDKFPDYEYVLSGWCYALQGHYNELFVTAENYSTDSNDDSNALITCSWFDDDDTVQNSTVIIIEGVVPGNNMIASPGTAPVDQSRVMTVAPRSPDQQYRADSEEDNNDFEKYISKLVSEEVVATSSEDTIVDDEQGVSSEDDEIDSLNEDVVQSDSAENNSDDGKVVTTSDRDYSDSDSSRDDDAVGDDGESDSNESTGDDDSTVVVDSGNKGNSDSDSDSDSSVEDGDNNDNGDGNGDDDTVDIDDDGDINDDGDGEDSSDVSSSDSDGEAPTSAPTSAHPTLSDPTTQGSADDTVKVMAVQGVATFEDLQVEDFSTDERNNFISTLADNANVDASFVRILLVSPGSVVVCWAVAFPEETTLSKKELTVLLSPDLGASPVR